MTETRSPYKVGAPLQKKTDIKADQVLAYIKAYKYEHDGNSPTIREIMDELGISSTSVVNYYLKNLERRGYIKFLSHGNARSIQTVGGSWSYAE